MIEENVTKLLNQWVSGDASVENKLISHIYPMLHKAAIIQMNKLQPVSLNPTALVNELYLKLKKTANLDIKDRNHFLAMASRTIRQILIDGIRKEQSDKRGGRFDLVTYQETEFPSQENKNDSFAVINWELMNELLHELELVDAKSVELIEMRFFAGLRIDEIAEIKNISISTVSRNWKFAKSWLISRVEKENEGL